MREMDEEHKEREAVEEINDTLQSLASPRTVKVKV